MYPYSTVCIKGKELLDKTVSFSICIAPTAMQPSLADAGLLLQYNFLLLNSTFPRSSLNSFQPLPAAVREAGIAGGRKTPLCTSPRRQLLLVLGHTTPQRGQPTELFIFQSLHRLPKVREPISSFAFCFVSAMRKPGLPGS